MFAASLVLIGCSSTATSADGSTTESVEGSTTTATGDGGDTAPDDGGTSGGGSSGTGGSGSETPGGGTTGGSTGSGSTSDTHTSGATSGSDSTGDSNTSGTTSGTHSTGETTSGETTSSETTSSGTTTGGTTTSGATTSGTTTGGTTTSGAALDCEIEQDCRLVLDCCECAALPIGQPDPDCPDMSCFQPICSALGIDEVECRFGTCRPERLNCNRNEVFCDGPEPLCPDGTLAEVADGCWTMACVPVELCNWVPDCSYCAQGEMCVVYVTQLGSDTHCDPIPPDCDDVPDCACAGELACIDPFDTCSDAGGTIQCDCPTCG